MPGSRQLSRYGKNGAETEGFSHDVGCVVDGQAVQAVDTAIRVGFLPVSVE
jgi:hypothetical protein